MATMIREGSQEQTVCRLVRCRQTRRFFRAGGWTDDASQADNFSDEIEAARACVQHDLNNVELVLRAPGGLTDLFCTPIR